MYKRILVPVENSPADKWILQHVAGLAKLCGAQVLLLHVADGWAARNMEQLNLRESQEMKEDRAYLERISEELRRAGVEVDAVLAAGDPAREIAAAADREKVDLIAMATHGHSLLSDVVHGTTATALRHVSRIPILMVRAPAPGSGESH
jgi:nucleotide-binding universal stress UspA family protein